MSDLGTDRLGPEADDFYETLLAVHAGLTADESAALNARLILILANQIADSQVLQEALAAARRKAGKA